MKADRVKLLDTFKMVKPALAGEKSPIVALRHAWFTGTHLRGYNDTAGLGVSVPLKTEFKGGVMGTTVLGLLDNSLAKDAVLQPGGEDGEMVVLVGSSRARLPLLAADGMVWVFPEGQASGAFEVDGPLTSALRHVMVSVPPGADSSGVTVVGEEDGRLSLYSSDGKTVSWARIATPKGCSVERMVLSELFCEQLMQWCSAGACLEVTEEYARAQTKDGADIYGKFVDMRELRFAEIIDSNILASAERVPLPKIFGIALDRVAVLAGSAPGASVRVMLKGDSMKMYARGDLGDINETLKITGAHEECDAHFDVNMLRRGVDSAKTFLANEGSFTMFGDGDTGYMVSASEGQKK